MMQTIGLLGFPVAGDKFPAERQAPRTLNPRGFYELPCGDIMLGLNTSEHAGKAVKLFPWSLTRTHPKYVSKLIVCMRERESAVDSTLRMMEIQTMWENLDVTQENAEKVYDLSYQMLDMYRVHQKPELVIRFEDMTNAKYARRQIERIQEFIGASDGDVEAALANIVARG